MTVSLFTLPDQNYGYNLAQTMGCFGPPVRGIARIAADICDVSLADVRGPDRSKHLVRCRALIVWAAKYFRRELSYARIAEEIGRRDHSSLINLFARAQDWRREDPDFREMSDELLTRVRAEL